MSAITPSWWERQQHADRRPVLLARGQIKTAIRRWFETQGFIEVDTACLQISPGNEAHLHAFQTAFNDDSAPASPYYLHTSPEFACKKLLAAGETKIFTFAPCFRNGERGRLHAPEFMMLEWYRVGAPYTQLMDDCAALLHLAASTTERDVWSANGRTCLVSQPLHRTTVDQAFARLADLPLAACFDGVVPNLAALRAETSRIGMHVANDDTWSDLFSKVLAEKVEPHLGTNAPEILFDYPTHEAALARPCAHNPRVAERFELYVCGVELANAFGELTDAAEQRRRFELEMAEKFRVYGRRYPIDADFIAALAHMPDASGCALGFDRLVMLATGAPSVAAVQWTPV
jgi:elongation factor P--(R)-beta-lysine ligase